MSRHYTIINLMRTRDNTRRVAAKASEAKIKEGTEL